MAEQIHFHVALDGPGPVSPAPPPGVTFRGMAPAGGSTATFSSDEAAARFFLGELLAPTSAEPERPTFRSITRPDRPEQVPGLRLERTTEQPATGTRLVTFTQAHRDIPVFGARAVVELRGDHELISADARLHEISEVAPVPTLTQTQALDAIAAFTGVVLPGEAAAGAQLNFYEGESENTTWHLVWLLKNIPAAPAAPTGTARGGHGFGPRPTPPRYNYLVDAHDGVVLFWYSCEPTVLQTPVKLSGSDEDGTAVDLWGCKNDAGYQLADPLRQIRTYDLQFADFRRTQAFPADPIASTTGVFEAQQAGVTAHHNAIRVMDFYKTVLARNGIDDNGMALISTVNCTVGSGPRSEFKNAFWWDGRMWYGQAQVGERLISLARYLDVMAHELTHGVVEATSNLVYRDQPGALNESFADILGVIINNWYTAPDPSDVSTWNWELGSGLGEGGLPLRDMSDPHRTGDPAHMDEFVHTRQDEGGVHINSNIHNRLAYEVLTSRAGNGSATFDPKDVALLFYLGMARLAPLATFSDARRAVQDVALTYFDGDPDRKAKLDAVSEAYDRVGIAPA